MKQQEFILLYGIKLTNILNTGCAKKVKINKDTDR